MIILTIRPTQASEGQTVQADSRGVFNFRGLSGPLFFVALQQRGSLTALSHVIPNPTVVSDYVIAFRVPRVGHGPTDLRPGMWKVIVRVGLWEGNGHADLRVLGPAAPAPTPPLPAPPPVQPPSGVHGVTIAPVVAGPGTVVTATATDGSIDFSAIVRSRFQVWLTQVGHHSALNRQITGWRPVSARVIEFTLPPIGINPNQVPVGSHRVVLRYGFWEGRGHRELQVQATAPAAPPSPSGPARTASPAVPTVGVPVPAHLFHALPRPGAPLAAASGLSGRGVRNILGFRYTPTAAVAPVVGAGSGTARTPVIRIPAAAFGVFRAGLGVRLAQLRISFPSSTTAAQVPDRVRGHEHDRIGKFFAVGTAATATNANSVTPVVDGEEIAPAIAELINGARKFIFMAYWALDQRMKLTGTEGQRGANNGLGPHSLAMLLKHRAETAAPPPQGLDIKVLVWRTFLDDEYAVDETYLEHLSSCLVPGRVLQGMDPTNAADQQRFLRIVREHPHHSGASEAQLLRFLSAYLHRPAIDANRLYRFPCGIDVAIQAHPAITGSHHQKLVVTDKGAFVGGMNLLQDYWDTRKHLIGDTRRGSSDGGSSGGVGGSFSSAGGNGILHDTGAILKGPIVERVVQHFAMRWDRAVNDGEVHGRLIERLEADLLPTLAREFSSATEKDAQRVTMSHVVGSGGRFSGTVSSADRASDALVVGSMPKTFGYGGSRGVKHIRDCYMRAVASMTHPASFAYFETQYLSDFGFAKHLFRTWWNHPRAESPFAFFVLPYNPTTAWPDEIIDHLPLHWPYSTIGWRSARINFVEAEFEILRWLEIRTARVICTKDGNGRWQPAYEIEHPRRQIRFTDSSLQNDPEELELDSDFLVDDAIELNSDGSRKMQMGPGGTPVPIRSSETYEAGEVMTRSDVMAYMLVANHPSHLRHSLRMGSSMQARTRRFLLENEIYVHSKAAAFLHPDSQREHYATVGSANLIPRSLEDHGAQDSELNVWWRGRAHVEKFLQNLMAEHLHQRDPTMADAALWSEHGMDNLNNLLSGLRTALRSSVMRLDVADRLRHQQSRPP